MREKVLIVPCSGIGKSLGSVAREAAYGVTEELCRDKTRIMPLALLVLGEQEARTEISSADAITLDGCVKACAAKVVEATGGRLAHALQVVDVCQRHPGLKPEGISELNDSGRELARALAGEVKGLVENMTGGLNHA